MKIKVCGMKYQDNINQITRLAPDYLGFIFYDKSPRNFNNEIPKLPKQIKKVGVFVDETIDNVIVKIVKYNLQVIQLHGEESPEYCKELVLRLKLTTASRNIEIIKVFSIKNKFDFSVLQPYEDVCDYYLFDTKGKAKGGNGYTFNWDVLKQYSSSKPYFLSGGIGLNEVEKVLLFLQEQSSKYCYALDVNSKFEIKPGLKNINNLETFKRKVLKNGTDI